MLTIYEVLGPMLLALSPAVGDRGEDPEDRWGRLTIVAIAIDTAASEATCDGVEPTPEEPYCVPSYPGSRWELAGALTAIAVDESRLALNIHAGRCAPDECDAVIRDGVLHHRAVSLWQVHTSPLVPLAQWRAARGLSLDATTTAARAAAQVLSWPRSRGQSLRCAMSAYAGVDKCQWPRAEERAKAARSWAARIRTAVSYGG
jgi:hypothetical protein